MASSFLTEFDLYLINQGSHYRIYDKLGAHVIEQDGVRGTSFAVWAPNARRLAVIGEFNGWNPDANLMNFHADCGVWECFVPGVLEGAHYKYHLVSNLHGYWVEKSDPYAFHAEMRPGTASRVFTLDGYQWGDGEWMASRHSKQGLQAPMSIYEVHLGSWRRVPDDNSRWLTYRELAEALPDYCADMGYTHVELMPVAEHPFDASWGYQVTGYYAPTSRFGDPHDFMHLVDALHRKGIGVILDWVPGHFPRDFPALSFFDGTHLYEHEDPRKREHKDWDTLIFNYGRREVANFLLSNALFWLDKYHIDGLRVDAVASMLYLDYSRKEGEWEPNHLGGRENLEAVDFLRRFNTKVYEEFPDVVTIAEESTAWPMVSRPTYIGGLGFGFKWDMGWMHDTLSYMSREPVHRRFHQNDLTFRGLYANTENFALPLSHDEVVHGKGSLINKMPGDYWQKFANLRLLFGYMFANTGKKLIFQGGEIAQWREWFEGASVDWHLLDFPSHRGIQNWMRDINRLYVQNPAMHVWDCDPRGFEWIDCNDSDQSVVSLMRKGPNPDDTVIFGFNFTPVPRHNYRVGAPREGFWKEILNSDAAIYGGSGLGNLGGQWTSGEWVHNRPCSLSITLPPLGVVAFQRQEG